MADIRPFMSIRPEKGKAAENRCPLLMMFITEKKQLWKWRKIRNLF